jgi:hypothetical protein
MLREGDSAVTVGRPADPIRQCFNSQLPPSQATSGSCGITLSRIAAGIYALDLGFQVTDRFVSADTWDEHHRVG